MNAPARKRRRSRSPSEIDILVGTNVRRLRSEQRMTLQELARHLGISHQQLQKYETGMNRLSAGMIPVVADALGVGLAALYEDDAKPTKSMLKTDQLRAECETLLRRTKSEEVLKTMARVLKALTAK